MTGDWRPERTVTLPETIWDETRYALRARIWILRDEVAAAVRRRNTTAATAATVACWLRQAELAYYRCGGADRSCWPAIYRPHPIHRAA